LPTILPPETEELIFSPNHIIPVIRKIINLSSNKLVIAWNLKEEESYKKKIPKEETKTNQNEEDMQIPGECSASLIGELNTFLSKVSFKQSPMRLSRKTDNQ